MTGVLLASGFGRWVVYNSFSSFYPWSEYLYFFFKVSGTSLLDKFGEGISYPLNPMQVFRSGLVFGESASLTNLLNPPVARA